MVSLSYSTLGLLVFPLGGIYTALSPCLFPILPISVLRLLQKDIKRSETLAMTASLIAGIMTSFTIFMFLTTFIFDQLGLWIIRNYLYLAAIFGIILIVLGVMLVVPYFQQFYGRLPMLFSSQLTKESYNILDLYFLGLVFTFIALPCAGPVFISLGAIVARERNFLFTLFGLIGFAIGLSIPYLILALLSTESRQRLSYALARHFRKVEVAMGILIIIIGILFIIPLFGGPIVWTIDILS